MGGRVKPRKPVDTCKAPAKEVERTNRRLKSDECHLYVKKPETVECGLL